MPSPRNNAKLTGDTHLPDVGDDDGSPDGLELADDSGKGENQAGYSADKDTPGAEKDQAA
jgi:hypothetical protein